MTNQDLYEPVGDVLRDGIKRELPVRLTDPERLSIAEAKAAAEAELDEHKANESDRRREAGKREEEIEKRIATMGAELRTREQKRVVVCYERWNNGQVELVRRDLDPRNPESVFERRAANLAESQRFLPGTNGEAESASAAGDDDVLAKAAAMQRAAGVAENDEGDVVPPEETAGPKRRGGKGKGKGKPR